MSLSAGRLGRQEARPEAVWGARKPVGSRLARQEARLEAVLGARRPVWSARRPRNVGFTDSSRENAGLVQAAGRVQAAAGGQTCQVTTPQGIRSAGDSVNGNQTE